MKKVSDNKVYEGVFDEITLETLQTLKRKNYFDRLVRPIKTGKEADVYLATKGDEYRAIKMFRVTSANFKKISDYIRRDYRFKTSRGNMRRVLMMWAKKEFRNLSIASKAHVLVPFPYVQLNNVIVMEYIDGPMLKDSDLENPKLFFEILLEQLMLMINNAKLIHGDLSEFNVLEKNQTPVIIDWGQAMTIKNPSDFEAFEDLYERDVKQILFHFNKKYNLNLDFEEINKKIKSFLHEAKDE